MNRRGFLQSILALGAAPAMVRAESLMHVRAWREVGGAGLVVPEESRVFLARHHANSSDVNPIWSGHLDPRAMFQTLVSPTDSDLGTFAEHEEIVLTDADRAAMAPFNEFWSQLPKDERMMTVGLEPKWADGVAAPVIHGGRLLDA